MKKMILTNGGNLLRHCELGWYFQKPNGKFIREVSEAEAQHICLHGYEIDFHFAPDDPVEFPRWEHLISMRVCTDYTNYKAYTSCNGGNYSFATFQDWFVATVNGEVVFRFVERFETSAEFGFDELVGSFQQDCGTLSISNVNSVINYNTQCQYFDAPMEEVVYQVDEILERISQIGTFDQLWNQKYLEIPSKWEIQDYDVADKLTYALSFSEKKNIIQRLKGLGVEKSKLDKTRTRRGGKRK